MSITRLILILIEKFSFIDNIYKNLLDIYIEIETEKETVTKSDNIPPDYITLKDLIDEGILKLIKEKHSLDDHIKKNICSYQDI